MVSERDELIKLLGLEQWGLQRGRDMAATRPRHADGRFTALDHGAGEDGGELWLSLLERVPWLDTTSHGCNAG